VIGHALPIFEWSLVYKPFIGCYFAGAARKNVVNAHIRIQFHFNKRVIG
jgi:hypothetical protein